MNNRLLKGIIFVAVGASSYGILATFVKLGMKDGFSTAELTFSQSFIGLLGLTLLNFFSHIKKKKSKIPSPNLKNKLLLILGGFSVGLTSVFYYLSLQYVSVSVCLVLLMQSVWMGSVLDLIVNKKKPTRMILFTIVLILTGTLLATNVFNQDIKLNFTGVMWGLLSGVCYTFSLFSSNRIAAEYPSLTRSLYLILGAVIIIVISWSGSLFQSFNPKVLYTWGLALGLLGTIIPPLLFTRGMPIIGIGLGTIVASLELPVSVMVASFILPEESVNFIEWLGIFIILTAVVIMNYSLLKKTKI